MTQWVKCLLHKGQKLSLIPTPIKSHVWGSSDVHKPVSIV